MSNSMSRRLLLKQTPLAVPVTLLPEATAELPRVTELFPTQTPELAREMVTVSHFNLRRVQQLVKDRPSLVRATWDWGFGDWETALGAASHMGNRAIAEFLIANGAVPSLFSATMLGQLELVKVFVATQPQVQRNPGPHSISLLAHAKAGGEKAGPVYEFLQSLGDAGASATAALSEVQQATILGRYVFGAAAAEEINVTVEQGHLTWTRKGTMGRWLFHLGDLAFYPAGAAAVRIRFVPEGEEMLMRVSDPGIVLSARRRDRLL